MRRTWMIVCTKDKIFVHYLLRYTFPLKRSRFYTVIHTTASTTLKTHRWYIHSLLDSIIRQSWAIGITYRCAVQREWEVNRWLRRWQAAICPQHVSWVVAIAFRYDNGLFTGQNWNIIISRVSLIVIVDETRARSGGGTGKRARVIAPFPRARRRTYPIFKRQWGDPVMSPALCASVEYNGVRVLRNPDAILRRQLRTRNRGKILNAVRVDIDFTMVARIE